MGRRGAIFAILVPMPETTMNKNSGFIFRQNNVRTNKAATCWKINRIRNRDFHMKPKAITHFVKQRTHSFFRRRVFAANAAHVPTAAFFCQPVFVHGHEFRQTT